MSQLSFCLGLVVIGSANVFGQSPEFTILKNPSHGVLFGGTRERLTNLLSHSLVHVLISACHWYLNAWMTTTRAAQFLPSLFMDKRM